MYPVLLRFPHVKKFSRVLLAIRPIFMIPHIIWSVIYSSAVVVNTFIAFWAILAIGRYPKPLWTFCERYCRYMIQLIGYLSLIVEKYPPFLGNAQTAYPVKVLIEYPERMVRLNVLFRFLIVVPHIVFMAAYSVFILTIYIAVIFTILVIGRLPESLWNFIVRYFIYSVRLYSYCLFLIDEFPPFHGEQTLAAQEYFQKT